MRSMPHNRSWWISNGILGSGKTVWNNNPPSKDNILWGGGNSLADNGPWTQMDSGQSCTSRCFECE